MAESRKEIGEDMASDALVAELLDLMVNDSENLERTMDLLTDDAVWVLEPGGIEYHGAREIRTFVRIAMAGRTHDQSNRIEITNWFADDENLCVEYGHGAVTTGSYTAGMRVTLTAKSTRYCITYHIRDGQFDRVHEYINGTSWWLNLLTPVGLGLLNRRVRRELART
jgi:SnoaL-like domain